MSGISLVDSINILFIQVFSALASGGAIVTAQYLGRQERKNACIAAKQLLYATTALAAIIMAVALIFHRALLRLIFGNIDPAVMENAIVYFQLSAVSTPSWQFITRGRRFSAPWATARCLRSFPS